MKKIIVALTVAVAAGCSSDADVISHNVSKAADYEDRKKKKYIVKIGGNLLVFSNEADAIGAIQAKEASSSQIKKQYPAKKAKKQDKVVEIKQEKQVLPDYQVNLAEIAALAERQAAYAQYQAFIQQMQYEALLNAYENWLAIEDEEEVLLLMAA